MLTFYEYNCEKDPVPTYYEYYRENEADANLPWIWPWEWSRCLQLLRKAPGSWCWSWTACGCQSPNMYWNQHNNGCHRQLFFCNQITYHQVNSKDPGQFSWTIRSSELGDGLLNSWFVIGWEEWSDPQSWFVKPDPGGLFDIKRSSYQYRKFHSWDMTSLWPPHPQTGISYSGKTTSLYWIRAQGQVSKLPFYPGVSIMKTRQSHDFYRTINNNTH